jgi:hypothetical protein
MSRIAAKLSNITPGKLDTEKGEERKYQMHRAVAPWRVRAILRVY